MKKKTRIDRLKTAIGDRLQRWARVVWCDTFGHPMYFDTVDVCGPSTCKLCGHKEPAIKWDRPPMPYVKSPKEDYGQILHKRPDPDTMPPTERPWNHTISRDAKEGR